MTSQKTRWVAYAAALALTATASLAVVSPAQAEDKGAGIGKGRALIHIDAPTATVTKTGKHSYRMVLPPESTGQWMGERTTEQGKTLTRVGDLTAQQLSNKWTKFRYSDATVPSTLAWAGDEVLEMELVQLSRPKLTDAGVRFDFTSRADIPAALTDVSINIQRAPKGRSTRATTTDFQISGNVYVDGKFDKTTLTTRLYTKSTGKSCWGPNTYTATAYVSLSGMCDGVAYVNQQPASKNTPAYGVKPLFKSVGGSLYYCLLVTPPGQPQFTFVQSVMDW